ncbi:MAG: hypothetical protein DI531_15535 [Brevundimonas sp.]|nr:MAG: hypothetical protein DI531_15535 [Brevundimonas sp.]
MFTGSASRDLRSQTISFYLFSALDGHRIQLDQPVSIHIAEDISEAGMLRGTGTCLTQSVPVRFQPSFKFVGEVFATDLGVHVYPALNQGGRL